MHCGNIRQCIFFQTPQQSNSEGLQADLLTQAMSELTQTLGDQYRPATTEYQLSQRLVTASGTFKIHSTLSDWLLSNIMLFRTSGLKARVYALSPVFHIICSVFRLKWMLLHTLSTAYNEFGYDE